MFKDVLATCPCCKEETTLAIAAPEAGTAALKKVSTTSCRKCKSRILAVTFPDGTVQLVPLQIEEPIAEPIETGTTLDSVFGLAEISRFPYSLWQPRGIEIDDFRIRPEWAEALRDALRDAQRQPRPLSVPRRIFISY